MTLPIAIGKNSANQTFSADLSVLPHLFLSYCYESQVNTFYKQLVDFYSSDTQNDVRFAIASTHSRKAIDVTNGFQFPYCFFSKDEYRSTVHCKASFLMALSKEMKNRKKFLSSKLLHHHNKKFCPPLLVLLDDVLDIIISSRKSIGLLFLELLLKGHHVNMHVIAASIGTCRNLLRQLMHINPLVKERFKQLFKSETFPINASLGAELIFTSEDFIFFKEAHAFDYHRLYPMVSEKVLLEEYTAEPFMRTESQQSMIYSY